MDDALRIAHRLERRARWNGSACAWRLEGTLDGQPISRPLGPCLYDGSSGIGLFLAEAASASGSEKLHGIAVGALEDAAYRAQYLAEDAAGFLAGRVGVAWAFARAAELLGRPEYLEQARALVSRLHARREDIRLLDVVSGAAGAIPPLLQLAGTGGFPEAVELARHLGDLLLRSAHREASGWSWARPGFARNLTGYAHGASGCAHGLLELYTALGDSRHLYAAERAMAYERVHFDAAADDWRDLRPAEPDAGAGGRRKARASYWCHGAPGIGLVRLRAWEVLRDEMYLEEARAALRTARASLPELDDYCLCHGVAGNCETLLLGSAVLKEPALGDAVRALATRRREELAASTKLWPRAVGGGVSDPRLMQGEAGVGLFFLRLADPGIPSVLFPTAPSRYGPEGRGSPEYAALRDEDESRSG